MMTGALGEPSVAELVIGVVGPQDHVERVMLLGHEQVVPSRLVAAPYRDDNEAADGVARLGHSVDVYLFTGRPGYEVASRAGGLATPATYIGWGGSALYRALFRGAGEGDLDPARVSIDTLTPAEVGEAYADLGLDAARVHVREGSVRPREFHRDLWRTGSTTAAVTGISRVARELRDDDVPVLELRPTAAAIRSALNTAALLGATMQLENSQVAIGIIDVPTLRDSAQQGPYRYWREDLKLSVHRLLLDEARRAGLLLWPGDDHSYLVAGTMASIASATRGLSAPPFVGRIRDELGIGVEVGIGLGASAQDAETHARTALTWASRSRGRRSFIVDRTGRALPIAVPAAGRRGRGDDAQAKGLEVLSRLTLALAAEQGGDAPLIVDAETTARSLAVTPRTARRLLRGLVEEGLAWPLPPARTSQPGRPRQLYRLISEKLDG